MQKAFKLDGTKYWKYILCYIVISHDPKSVMKHLEAKCTLKESSIKEPDKLPGVRIRKHIFPTSEETWAMSSDLYVARAIANVKWELERSNQTLRSKVATPMLTSYRPEWTNPQSWMLSWQTTTKSR